MVKLGMNRMGAYYNGDHALVGAYPVFPQQLELQL